MLECLHEIGLIAVNKFRPQSHTLLVTTNLTEEDVGFSLRYH
jgi:hypothetical protein